LKWTAVRYRAKPEQADENQRLSEAVFRELAARSPAGLAYEVLRLADGTFVHIAAIEDGAQPVSALESFRVLPRHRGPLPRATEGRRGHGRRPVSDADRWSKES